MPSPANTQRDEDTIRELGRDYGHEVGGLRGRENGGEMPVRLMRVSVSTS